jgi:hypothetical protein
VGEEVRRRRDLSPLICTNGKKGIRDRGRRREALEHDGRENGLIKRMLNRLTQRRDDARKDLVPFSHLILIFTGW